MNNKYDSDYEIRLATLEAMGGDVSKRYDSVYEIDLEILRLTKEGGGGGIKLPDNVSITEWAIGIQNYGQTTSLNGDKVFLTDGETSTIELHANGDFYDVNWGREPVVISRNVHDFIFSSPGKIIKLTQEEYDALEEKEETTLYIIK